MDNEAAKVDWNKAPDNAVAWSVNLKEFLVSSYGMLSTQDNFRNWEQSYVDENPSEFIYRPQYDEQVISVDGNTSDGYHTFNELYEFRKMYNAVLFNEWALFGKYQVHKSLRHSDGEVCFGDGEWFIVVALLPNGQISNHYKLKDWELFKIPEYDKALFEYDGHNGSDVLDRLSGLISIVE